LFFNQITPIAFLSKIFKIESIFISNANFVRVRSFD